MKFHFSGSARDVNLDGGQPTPLHSQVELFVSFAYSVTLKTCHGKGLVWQRTKSNGKRGVTVGVMNQACGMASRFNSPQRELRAFLSVGLGRRSPSLPWVSVLGAAEDAHLGCQAGDPLIVRASRQQRYRKPADRGRKDFTFNDLDLGDARGAASADGPCSAEAWGERVPKLRG